jgi:hypothetical protein
VWVTGASARARKLVSRCNALSASQFNIPQGNGLTIAGAKGIFTLE